ncbi:Sterile alpha motif domain-containing protein 9-like [Liparis tanakae]|uniref:Sterile alpha motif domain-containing protein 9-like n=1 Tax=Liparis tanakae TaxID=230148 RepID=A0A4Z2G9F1_9TELE|nr:Sterile alpha motif domain-containing protein 9-like [Liparis tanakae]
MELTPNISVDIDFVEYLTQNPNAANTQLLSFLALLNAYVPDSYLLMSECQQILGPPDPIHRGPPFEERVEPFAFLIKRSLLNPDHVCIEPRLAQIFVALLAALGISKTAIVKKLMFSSLCGDRPQPHLLQFIKYLLTKRKWGEKGREKFSRLIEDISTTSFYNAVSVLKTASNKFKQSSIYPQTLSRLYYIRGGAGGYEKAEEWAKRAIERNENNSYVADTLGQIYKNLLMKARQLPDIQQMADKAFTAFKDVERKADQEEGPELRDMEGTVSISDSFNNRGLFGFVAVAMTVFEKLRARRSPLLQVHIQNLTMEVRAKFDFFERYLTYSKPTMTSAEPDYFWKFIAKCYEMYTTAKAAESRSFPGLLEGLSQGHFTSKGRRAGFKEARKTASDLEEIHEDSMTFYEANPDDVQAAECYVLANITLSNRIQLYTSVNQLQAVMHRFFFAGVGRRSPEFYLMALLLFWPQEESQDMEQPATEAESSEDDDSATEDESSEEETLEVENSDEEQGTSRAPEQLPLDFMFDLQQYVTFMEKSFERSDAKYLRGRYLSPLFFLGKGSGLNRWIHKSRLDEVVGSEVDAELAGEQDTSNKEKWKRINAKWTTGDVWRIPEIEDMLLPVRVEPCHTPMRPQVPDEEKVFVCAGGRKITVTKEAGRHSAVSAMLFYLGFNIKGPFVFQVSAQ